MSNTLTSSRPRWIGLMAMPLVLLLVLAACGTEEPTATQPPPQPTATSPSTGTTPAPTQAAPTATARPAATPAPSFDAASYYKGQTIRVFVGFNPGGGTDTQARLFSKEWGKYFPGNPRFVVTNLVPDVAARNTLYDSKPDGKTIYLSASSGIATQFYDAQAKFKSEEYRIVGTHTGSSSVLFATKDVPYGNAREAMGGTTPLRIDQSEPDSTGAMRLAAVSKWLNIPMKFIPSPGGGTSTSLLMIERNDINAYMPGGGGTVWYSLPFLRPGWFTEGTLRPFLKTGASDVPIGANAEIAMPADVPYVGDLLTDPAQKESWEIFANADTTYAKVFMLPPGTPDGMVDAFRQSYKQLLEDAKFKDELERVMGQPIEYTNGDQIEQVFDKMASGFATRTEEFNQWIEWAKELF